MVSGSQPNILFHILVLKTSSMEQTCLSTFIRYQINEPLLECHARKMTKYFPVVDKVLSSWLDSSIGRAVVLEPEHTSSNPARDDEFFVVFCSVRLM